MQNVLRRLGLRKFAFEMFRANLLMDLRILAVLPRGILGSNFNFQSDQTGGNNSYMYKWTRFRLSVDKNCALSLAGHQSFSL